MNPGDFEFLSSEASLGEGRLGDVLHVFVSDFTLRQSAGEAKVREVERKMGGVTSELFILRKLLQDFQTRVNDDHDLIMRLQHEIEALRGRVRSLDSKHAAVEAQSGRLDLRIEQLREQLSQSCEDTNQNVSRLISNFARSNLSRNNIRRDSSNNNIINNNRRELTQQIPLENAEPSSECGIIPQANTQCNSSETEPSLGNSLVSECSISQVETAFPNKTTKEVTNEEILANDETGTNNDMQAEPQPHSLCNELILREKEGMQETQETFPENNSLINNNQEQLQVTDLKLSSGANSEYGHANPDNISGETDMRSNCSLQSNTSNENSRKETTSDTNDDIDSISQQVDTEQINLMANGVNITVRTEEKSSISPHFSKATENKLEETEHELTHTDASLLPTKCMNPVTPEETPEASCSVTSLQINKPSCAGKSQGVTKKNKSRKYRGRKRKDSQNTDSQQSSEETDRHPPTQTHTESISLTNSKEQLSDEGAEQISTESHEKVSAEGTVEKSTVDEEQVSVEIKEQASNESQLVLAECTDQVSDENQEEIFADCVEQVSADSTDQIPACAENQEASAECTVRSFVESQHEILESTNLESCLGVQVTETDQGVESLPSSWQESEEFNTSKNEDNCENYAEITSKNEKFLETMQENPSQGEIMNSLPVYERCFGEDRNTIDSSNINLSINKSDEDSPIVKLDEDEMTGKNEESQQTETKEQSERFSVLQVNNKERRARRTLNISEEKSPLSKRRVICKMEMDDEEIPDLSDADNLMEDMKKLKEKSTEQRKKIEIKTPSGEITDLQPKKPVKIEEKRMEPKEEEPKDDVVGMCANCSNLAKLRCGNCRQAFYCKKECQKEHWKTIHKDQCRPFQILESPELGRYMIASRDLKAGDVILKEEPLVVGPKQITEPICLGCYKRVDGSYRCQKCHWPMCGPQCEKSPDHLPECVVGVEIGSPIEIANFEEPNHFYEVVFPLRCLALKKKSPKKYDQLMSLDSHYDDRKGTHVHVENQKSIVNMLRNYFLLQQFPIEDIDSSEKSIHNVTGIIDVNALEIRMQESEILGLYPNFAMLEHSCTPNTKHTFTDSRHVVLKAAVDIKRGEHLSTMYTHILWGTLARRDHLKHSKYFMCTCFRCSDPTELGTNFSTIRCKRCTNGFMLSAAPLDELADWLCTSCNETIKNEEVTEINLKLGEEVEKVLAAPTVPLLEDLLQNQAKTTVHPNHYHLFSMRHTLLQMYGRDPSCASEEYMKKKERMCQDFLKVCTALDPGMARLSPYAGVALYEYHLAVLSRTRQDPGAHQTDPAALKKDVETAKALLQQCIRVLQEEPKDQPEGQLCQVAQQNLIELRQWEASLFST